MATLTPLATAWEKRERSAKPQQCGECGRRVPPTAARCQVCRRNAVGCTRRGQVAAEPSAMGQRALQLPQAPMGGGGGRLP
eukprot:13449714-Alexandrium_andersonii.AAC.1